MRFGTRSIHLVDESQTRHFISFHLSVNSQRLSLYSTYRTKYKHSTVKHTQTTFHFNGKINVPGRIDQVDGFSFPLNSRGSTGNGNTTFLFKLHMVHRGTIAFATNFLNLVNTTAIEQNTFTQRSFPRVNVC